MNAIGRANKNYAEMSSNQLGMRKVGKNLFGRSIGTDVVVFGNDPEQPVTHTPPDEVRLVPARTQIADDCGR
jgi:hypothetical protein